MNDFFDAEHIRLFNAGLTALIISVLSFKLVNTWARLFMETRAEAFLRRAQMTILIGVFGLAAYASATAFRYGLPAPHYVPILTGVYVLYLLSLVVPIKAIGRTIKRFRSKT